MLNSLGIMNYKLFLMIFPSGFSRSHRRPLAAANPPVSSRRSSPIRAASTADTYDSYAAHDEFDKWRRAGTPAARKLAAMLRRKSSSPCGERSHV